MRTFLVERGGLLVVLLRELGIDVLLGLLLLAQLLDLEQLVPHLLDVVLDEALLERLHRLAVALQLGQHGALARQHLGLLHVVLGDALLEELLRAGDLLQGELVVLELDVGRGLVVVVKRLVGVQLDRLLVEVERIVEVLLLELLISLVLALLRRVLHVHLLWLRLLFLGWRRGRVFLLLGLLRLRLGLGLACIELVLELLGEVLDVLGTGLLLKHLEHLLQARVLLHVDCRQLRVLHDGLQLAHEAGVLEEVLGLGVLHELEQGVEVGLVELRIGALGGLALGRLEVLLEVCVGGIDLESLLVGIDGLVDAFEVEERAALALIASGPGGVHLDAGLCVLEGLVVLSVVEVGAGPVGVEDVVGGVALDGLGEELDSLLVALALEGLVALVLVLGGELVVAH